MMVIIIFTISFPFASSQLRYLKSYEGNVADLSLDFTVTRSTFGESETIELKPGGRQIPVTEENRVEYMHLMAYYKLNKQVCVLIIMYYTHLLNPKSLSESRDEDISECSYKYETVTVISTTNILGN